MDNLVKYMPENTKGRDFVVGDLHGTTHLLQVLLEEVKFDPAADRLFSVGDLIDRGEDSPGALAYLGQPWFHAVLGNHEEMLLDYLLPKESQRYDLTRGKEEDHAFLANGGEYWFPSNPISKSMEQKLRELPLMIVVGKDSPNRFQIVHASLVKSMNDKEPLVSFFSDAEIDSGLPWTYSRYIQGYDAIGEVRDGLLWDRTLYYALFDVKRKNVSPEALIGRPEGMSPVYVGHSPVMDPLVFGNHHMIDTGGYMAGEPGHGLSLAEVGSEIVLTAGYGNEEYIVWRRPFVYL